MMSATATPPPKADNVLLPSMSNGPFLHPSGPASSPLPNRKSSITDTDIQAHNVGAETGRPQSAQQEYDRRDSTVDEMMFQGQKRKTSDPDYVPDGSGESAGGSSADLHAKRRSSAFSVTANRLDSLTLNQRRSSGGSTYSTNSSGGPGWSPAPGAQYPWQGATPNYAFGSNPAAPYAAPQYGPDPSQAPRAAPLAEQLASYGFPPQASSSAMTQAQSAIGPITARRGSVPVLSTRSSIGSTTSSGGSDPRRVFSKDDEEEEETVPSRAASIDETNMSAAAAAAAGSPYSRSPELRISHKLAERKRRKEMSQLFDELRDSVPSERGNRSSKWETLVKAIDFIQHLKEANEELQRDNELMRSHIGIPSRGSGSLPFLQNLPAPQAFAPAPGAIPLPPPAHAQPGGESYVYGGNPYVTHAVPAGWPSNPSAGGGQATPRPGAPYMSAPHGAPTAASATAS